MTEKEIVFRKALNLSLSTICLFLLLKDKDKAQAGLDVLIEQVKAFLILLEEDEMVKSIKKSSLSAELKLEIIQKIMAEKMRVP